MHRAALLFYFTSCTAASERLLDDSGGGSDSAFRDDSAVDDSAGGDGDSGHTGETGCETKLTWYLDADADGYGDSDTYVEACEAPPGYVADASDCDDLHSHVYPGAPEFATDGLDNDCDGSLSMVAVDELGLWSAVGTSSAAYLGLSLATDGDFDGDGSVDLVLGGNVGFLGDEQRGGMVMMFRGPLDTETDVLTESDASALLYGGFWDYWSVVCSVGDLDSDGFDDLIIGDPAAGNNGIGVVYVERGPLEGTIDLTLDGPVFSGTESGNSLGRCAGPGDVDGDGVPDLVLTASHINNSWAPPGSVYVLLGPAEHATLEDADQILQGEIDHEYIGYGVEAVGDLDGNGTGDYTVTNYQYADGTAADGVAAYLVTDFSTTVAHPRDMGVVVHHDLADNARGLIANRIGDVTGDGYADVGLGVDAFGNALTFHVVEGSVGGESERLLSEEVVSFESSAGGPNRWISFATSLGDWNGDGQGALAIADAQFATEAALSGGWDCVAGDPECSFGAVYVVKQPVEPGTHDLAREADRIEGSLDGGFMGGGAYGPALRGGTDLNADGAPDLAFSSWYAEYDAVTHAGAAYVLFGGNP